MKLNVSVLGIPHDFGIDLALNDDASLLYVAQPGVAQIHVFARSGGTWAFQRTLSAPANLPDRVNSYGRNVGSAIDVSNGKLVVGDVFLDTTLRNLAANGGRIAIFVYDAKTLEGYQIRGAAEHVSDGPVVAMFKAMVEQMFQGAATAKGALVITPETVIVTTPGAENKKVL